MASGSQYHLANLPNELLHMIMYHLQAQEVVATLCLVCKNWQVQIMKDEIWIARCKHEFAKQNVAIMIANYKQYFSNAMKFYFACASPMHVQLNNVRCTTRTRDPFIYLQLSCTNRLPIPIIMPYKRYEEENDYFSHLKVQVTPVLDEIHELATATPFTVPLVGKIILMASHKEQYTVVVPVLQQPILEKQITSKSKIAHQMEQYEATKCKICIYCEIPKTDPSDTCFANDDDTMLQHGYLFPGGIIRSNEWDVKLA